MRTIRMRIALGIMGIFIIASASLLADQVPSWTREYLDCGEEPLSQFLRMGWFEDREEVRIENVASEEKLWALRGSFLKTYPNCKLTPLLEFLTAIQMMEFPANRQSQNGLQRQSQILPILRQVADRFPNSQMPFGLRVSEDYYPRGTLLAPAALMRIAQAHSREITSASPSEATRHYQAALQTWEEIVKRFPEAKSNGDYLFSANALAKLISFSACLAGGPPGCTAQPAKAAKYALIALDKFPNIEYNDGHYCGNLHPHALFALAHVEKDADKACANYYEILRLHAEEGFFACETDAGGAIGYSALDMMHERCGATRTCADCLRQVVADKTVPHDWRGRAQYKLAVYYQATLQDYRRAIQEYRILAEQFGDVLEDDEDDDRFTQPRFESIARERIGSLQLYLNSTPAPLKQ